MFYKKYKNQIGIRSAQPVNISLTRTAVVADACSTKRRYFVDFLARIVTPLNIRKIRRVVSLEIPEIVQKVVLVLSPRNRNRAHDHVSLAHAARLVLL